MRALNLLDTCGCLVRASCNLFGLHPPKLGCKCLHNIIAYGRANKQPTKMLDTRQASGRVGVSSGQAFEC